LPEIAMPKSILPQYSQCFPAEKEFDVASLLDTTSDDIYDNMQGRALEDAITVMQSLVTRHYQGDHNVTIEHTLRAAREIRALMNEKSALRRQCRAEAIEMLGLRPRAPISDTQAAKPEEVYAAKFARDILNATKAKEAQAARPKVVEAIVKKTEPTTTTAPAKVKNPANAEPVEVS